MNRRTVLPIHRTDTISQYKDQRNAVMNGRKHIRRRVRGEVLCLCTEGPVQSSLRGSGGVV